MKSLKIVKPIKVRHKKESILKKNFLLSKAILLARNKISLNLKHLLVLVI